MSSNAQCTDPRRRLRSWYIIILSLLLKSETKTWSSFLTLTQTSTSSDRAGWASFKGSSGSRATPTMAPAEEQKIRSRRTPRALGAELTEIKPPVKSDYEILKIRLFLVLANSLSKKLSYAVAHKPAPGPGSVKWAPTLIPRTRYWISLNILCSLYIYDYMKTQKIDPISQSISLKFGNKFWCVRCMHGQFKNC